MPSGRGAGVGVLAGLLVMGMPLAGLCEPGRDPGSWEEPPKVSEPDISASGPETRWWMGTTLGAATASGSPREFLAGGGGLEWGVWWQFAPWYRLGLRNDFFLTVLPWSDRSDPALVGASDDPDDPAGVHPEVSLSSGLLMTHGFHLGSPVWLELALGPAFLAAEPMGWASILPLPAGGAGLQVEVGRVVHSIVQVGIRCDFQVLPHRDTEGDRVLFLPKVSVGFVF